MPNRFIRRSFVQQAALGAEHRHEARTVGGIAPESAVDELASCHARAACAPSSFQLAMLLQREKGIEHAADAARKGCHRACPAIVDLLKPASIGTGRVAAG
jgi:hypothetical protein